MSKKSLKRHFCQTLILPMLVALLVVGVAAFYSARHEIEEVYDAQLAHTARIMLALMRHEVEEGESNMQMLHERFGEVGHVYEKHIAVRIWKGDTLFYRSESAKDFGLQHVIAGFSTKEIASEDWRFFVLPDNGSGLTVEAAEKYSIRLDIIHKILLSMFAPVLALVVVIPPLFWLGLRYGLKPLVRLSEEVGARSPDDLTAISEEKTPEEILPLAQAINRLLTRLQAALYKERRFTDLAAHELKTPLAVIKTLTQSAQRTGHEQERQQLLADLNAATDRAANMVAQLLALARLDHENLKREEVSLNDIMHKVSEELAPLACHKQISIVIHEDDAVIVPGNREMLLLAMRNLLDNAIKYTPAGGVVKIEVGKDANTSSVAITDTGPGIPKDKITLVTERFYRIPGNRESGSGLGLTIVARVAELMKAQFILENNAPTGLRVRLSFKK